MEIAIMKEYANINEKEENEVKCEINKEVEEKGYIINKKRASGLNNTKHMAKKWFTCCINYNLNPLDLLSI